MVMTASEPFLGRLRRHLAELLVLAVPVGVSRVGLMVMTAVDAAVVGRHSVHELAYFGLANLPVSLLTVSMVGLLLGTVALTAHAQGAGRDAECGAVLRSALPFGALVGIVCALTGLVAEPLLRAAGQSEEMADGAGPVFAALVLGCPGMALFSTASFFLEGLKRPLPGMLVMVVANVINLLLNLVLVTGWLGGPEWGAVGSALATAITRTAMGLALTGYIFWIMSDRERWAVRGPFRGWWRNGVRLRRFGYATGLSLTVEGAAFTVLGLFAGMLSPLAMGAFTISFNLIALSFMAAIGLASATAVRVGVGYGRRDAAEMAMAGWTGLGVTLVLLGGFGAIYHAMPVTIAAIYTDDGDLLARVAPLIAFSAWVLVADGAQAMMGNALRGRNDAWVPTLLHMVAYGVVMVPLSAWLAFGLERGVRGLLEAVLVAGVIALAVLSARFAWLCRRDARRGVFPAASAP